MATQHSKTARWQGDLLPHIVDRLASEKSQDIYGLWPVAPASYQAGFREINYAQLANIVNGLAWWIIDQLGGPGNGEQVLTYIGPNDVRYCALVLAAVKTGYVMFLTSPRNSPAAHQALFDKLECQSLLTTDPVPPAAVAVIEAVKPRTLTVPSIDQLLGTEYPAYIYSKTYEEAQGNPFIIIHTSGSTGLPKPLVWTHGTVARHINLSAAPAPEGIASVDSLVQGKRVMVTLPPFHGAGVAQYLFSSVPFGNISIAPAAIGIVTAQGLLEALKQTPADVALLVPSVVAELAQNPELLDACAQYLELILYIGGDLPTAIGDIVAVKIPLRCQWGASEVGIPQQLMPPELGPLDWRYVRFHPGLGAVFDEITVGVYELVIRRNDVLADTQVSLTIRGQDELQEYRTKDLFAPHPTVSDAWCWRARADDIIVFLNGEKTNPVSMEQRVVAKNHELSGALVVGSQRFQAALLIEPTAGSGPNALATADQAALIERVWPSIEEANRAAPAHARVEKSLILVTSPDRPFIRAGKGTIQRAASLAQYKGDIDKLYMNAEAAQDDTASETIYSADTSTISSLIRDAIQDITGWASLDKSDSFFDRGLDSLQALQVTRTLRRALHRPDFALSTIYQNSTIEQLTAAILERNEEPDERDMMEPLLSTYKGLIQQIPAPKSLDPIKADSIDILLTGSTGGLGTQILRALLNRPGIGHIFCLNRGADGGRSVQSQRFTAAGVTNHGLDDRVTFLQANLAHPSLGLDDVTYETLRARVGLVLHNAWPVNFNLSLPAFRPHLAGVVNLCGFSAAAAPRAVRILFISSVGAVSGEALQGEAAPETVLESVEIPGPSGYSRSKFLSELLCDTAAKHLGIPVTVVRVGQVAGSSQQGGVWNRAEWLPSLVVSSLHLGCFPENLGPQFSEIDWIPSDLLAEAVVDLAAKPTEEKASPGTAVFNLRNPSTTTWDKLLPAIVKASSKGQDQARQSEIVSPSAWVDRLQQSVVAVNEGDESDVAAAAVANPAIKLLDFYQKSLWGSNSTTASRPMSVEHAVQASPTLRGMPAVGVEWMRKWVDEWLMTM
ncbi:acetyl-CoA synthetase-like protein [Xylariaceae sp. AK1471]|nr:acetyl-CoA synthetase-like protein [Xylariaceae sp. AK1471]